MNTTGYPRSWKWPGAAKIAVVVNFGLEAFEYQCQYSHNPRAGVKDHFSLSFADYGWKAGIWRILRLLDRNGIVGNMSTSGLAAEQHPEAVRAVADAGHEIVGHGWVNDVFVSDEDPLAEENEIRRCTQALTHAAGRAPVGWTSAASMGSINTLTLLKSHGYIWNGDDASDDLPFLRATRHGDIVVLPRINLPTNDLAMWMLPKNSPTVMWDSFKATFDQLYAEGVDGCPKWIELTLHAHFGGRPTLLPVAQQCLDYARSHSDVWFARRQDIAEWSFKLLQGNCKETAKETDRQN